MIPDYVTARESYLSGKGSQSAKAKVKVPVEE